MLQWVRVSGDSLYPDYKEGDFVLVIKIPFFLNRLKRGDVIVFQYDQYSKFIKVVENLEPESGDVRVVGLNLLSTDSRQFGPIPRSSVIGKVIWHIRASR